MNVMDIQLKMSLIEAVKFYGSVASTNGIEESIKRTANKNIERLISALSGDLDMLLARASGLTLSDDEEK